MTKKFVWIGLFVGSTIGSMLPALWGGEMTSVSGLLLSLVGGIVGLYVGFRLGRSI